MNTGQMIRDIRIAKGMTQDELAEKTAISARTIQRIENGQVDPRAYSLHRIAEALEVPYESLNNSNKDKLSSSDKSWLILLHLSGLLFLVFPPAAIWLLKRDNVPNLREHALSVINFQINVMIIVFPCAILSFLIITIPVLVLAVLAGSVVIVINTIRVALNLPHNYPLFKEFLKM